MGLLRAGLIPRRLGGGKQMQMPYPEQIEIDNDAVDKKEKRRQERHDMKFWKERALKLEYSIEKLEDMVASLEQSSEIDQPQLPRLTRSNSAPAKEGRSSPPVAVAASTASSPNPNTSPAQPPSSSPDKPDSGDNQRKDKIMKQLVSEMERIIESHTKDPDEGDDIKNSSFISANSDPLPSRKDTKIETGMLEDLLKQVLAADQDGSAPSASSAVAATTKKSKSVHKSTKPKPHSTLYQLSCKQCIGQNFVGSTRSDLRSKVKEHYGVVWQVVQTVYGTGDHNVDGGGIEGSTNEQLSFRGSSFSHHIASGHCQECTSEDEVMEWCVENVKVERISRHTSLNRSI